MSLRNYCSYKIRIEEVSIAIRKSLWRTQNYVRKTQSSSDWNSEMTREITLTLRNYSIKIINLMTIWDAEKKAGTMR